MPKKIKPKNDDRMDFIRLVLQIKDTPGNRIALDKIQEIVMRTNLPDPTMAVFKVEQTHIIRMASTKKAPCPTQN